MVVVPDIEGMFQPGVRHAWPDGTRPVIEVQHAGTVSLATGRLVACDPDWGWPEGFSEIEPFNVSVPPGRYPVTLSILRWDDPGDRTLPTPHRPVAAAKVTIRDAPVESWEIAAPVDKDPAEGDGSYRFGVDSGTGCFLDAQAVGFLAEIGEPGGRLSEAIYETLHTPAAEVVDSATGLNVVVFAIGLGDGAYLTWLGRSASGDAVCFVADLDLLDNSLGTLPE